jgi:hypothetical protein
MKTVTLHDGRQVDSSSEEWRHECEAIALLKMPLTERKKHLQAVEGRRGIPARQQLQVTLMALWINQQGDRLAAMDQDEREWRVQQLARDNKEHIMRRIMARMGEKAAANDNNQADMFGTV